MARPWNGGELELEDVAMSPGDSALVPEGVPHGIANASDSERLLLMVMWGKPRLQGTEFARGRAMVHDDPWHSAART